MQPHPRPLSERREETKTHVLPRCSAREAGNSDQLVGFADAQRRVRCKTYRRALTLVDDQRRDTG